MIEVIKAAELEPRFAPPMLLSADLMRSAEVMADQGEMRLAADLCEQLVTDDRISAVLDTRIDTLLGLPVSFSGRKRQVKALEASIDWDVMLPESSWKQFHRWALLLNIALGELEWTRDPITKRELPRLVVKNPRFLRWDWNTRKWMLAVAAGAAGFGSREIEITPGDGRWVMWNPQGPVRPWVHGAYRPLMRWYLLKQLALRDWGFYSERHGLGTWHASGFDGTDIERRALVTALRNQGSNAAFVTGPGADLKLLEATANTWQTFSAQLDAADNGYAVTILGQNLTTEANSGTGSISKVMAGVAMGRVKFDAESSATFIHEQIMHPWAVTNWGTGEAPWPERDTSTPDDVSKVAASKQTTAQAASTLFMAGANIDLDKTAKDLGFGISAKPQEAPATKPEEPAVVSNEELSGLESQVEHLKETLANAVRHVHD